MPVLVSAGIIALALLLMKTPPGRRLRERAAAWCAMRIRFRYWALARYRREILARDGEVRPPFAAETIKLSRVYVGRKPTDASAASMEDQLSRERDGSLCIVVTGDPGAGKSLLLQSLLYGWALSGRSGRDTPIPVRIKLSQLDPDLGTDNPHPLDGDTELYPLHKLLTASFADRGVPHAERFVLTSLRNGRLSVMCDGLDEVLHTRETAVRVLLERARERYPKCRFTVTCRAAVYRDRLFGFDEVSLAGFTTDNIEEFLDHWAERPGVSQARIARLRTDLAEGGIRVRQLAQSPLLLTFMAHTYGRDAMVSSLPGSRSVFYDDVTGFLLEFKTDKQFPPDVKRIALENLARKAITAPGQVLRYRDVMTELKTVLDIPGLNSELADALLWDLVHRTGLLSQLNARGEYHFAHLSLLEYFAARSFGDDFVGLMHRYRAAPDSWRESVRLWTGHTREDQSPIIAEVAEADLGLGLECLVDTGADNFPSSLLNRAFAALPTDPVVRSALAALAADHRLLSERIRGQLMRCANEVHEYVSEAAVRTLAASRHPAAAHFLRLGTEQSPIVTEAFTSMGDTAADLLWQVYSQLHMEDVDLSVPDVSASLGYDVDLSRGLVQVALIDEIAALATPVALRCLAECLDADLQLVRVTAARHLAQLVRRPHYEAVLHKLDCRELASSSLPWAPFAGGHPPGFARIMNRVTEILRDSLPSVHTSEPPSKEYLVDSRLAMYHVAEAVGRGCIAARVLSPLEREKRCPAFHEHRVDLMPLADIAALSESTVREILLELVSAADIKTLDLPANVHAEWTWTIVDSLPEGAGISILRLVRQRPVHDLDLSWRPIHRRVRTEYGRDLIRYLQWVLVGFVSVVLALAYFLSEPAVQWLPPWFAAVATMYAAVAMISMRFGNFEFPFTVWAFSFLISVVPMGMVGWSQLTDWLGLLWGWVATIAVVASVITAAYVIFDRLVYGVGRWGLRLGLSFIALCSGLVGYRLVADPWGPVWIQWLAGMGTIVVALVVIEGGLFRLSRGPLSIASYVPLTALSWFGFRDWTGPGIATMLAVGAFCAIAFLTVAAERRKLLHENPLRDVIVELTRNGLAQPNNAPGHLSTLANTFKLSRKAV